MAKDEAKWAYWTKQVKDWRSSGLSRNAYCKREGLKPTTFDYWRPLIVSDQAEAKAVKPVGRKSETPSDGCARAVLQDLATHRATSQYPCGS